MKGNKLTRFWHELKRRKVVGVIIIYASTVFILLQLVSILIEPLRLPPWTMTLLIVLLSVGFPIAIIFSWVFDVSSKGIQKTDSLEQESLPDKKSLDTLKPDPPEKSIIVLPFENISSDPEQEYFSDGLTEEIITDLSYVHDLLVISRSSAMTFKGAKNTIKEIAGKVNVRYVLEGSVRKSENNLRIVAQLIDASNDSHIWAEKYNEKLEGIFKIQENVSRSIVDALKIKLSPLENKQIAERPIDNVFAFDSYKKAYHEIMSMSKERVEYGLNLLNKGLKIVGDNSVIYAGIAFAYFQYVNLGIEHDKNITKAEEFIQKAFDINPDQPEAHSIFGLLNIFKGNFNKAIFHLHKAHVENPNDIETMFWLSLFYSIIGKNDAGKSLVKRCVTIDPINLLNDSITGWNHFFGGRFEMALKPLLSAYNLSPENKMHQFFKSLVLVYNDSYDSALEFINKYVDETDDNMWTQLTVFLKYALIKDKEKADLLLKTDFIKSIQFDLQNSYHIASFYSLLGDNEKSLYWLKNAVERGFINYPLLNEQDKLLNNVREEPEFKKLMKRVKKEWENFEV